MSISYLCYDCAKKLNMHGFDAVNEVGRKNCEGCGDNEANLIVVDADICATAIYVVNKESECDIKLLD